MNLHEFFLDTPLYKRITLKNYVNEDECIKQLTWHHFWWTFDWYNPILNNDTTYEIKSSPNFTNKLIDLERIWKKEIVSWTIKLECKRSHQVFYFIVEFNWIVWYFEKVWQYPSLADFHTYKVKQYKNVISKEIQYEYVKAIWLASHWIGIWSFVYLRRIFEKLVCEAWDKWVESKEFELEDFHKSRMEEKIQLASKYLPEFLVSHKKLYSILSKWIHELSEEECLQYFDRIRVWIEIILDEKVIKNEREKKIREASKRINHIQ